MANTFLTATGIPKNQTNRTRINDHKQYQSGIVKSTNAAAVKPSTQNNRMQLDAGGNPLGEKATANPTKLPSLKKQAELINRGWDERTFNGGFREGFGEKAKKPNEPDFDATSSPSSIYLEQFRKNADILFADAPTVVKELGETETFSLLSKLDAGMLDGWSGMTTNQQLALMKRTNLTPEQQWVLLNKRDEYLEGAAKAADLYTHYSDYGLTKQQADEYANALVKIAVDRGKLAATGGLSGMDRRIRTEMIDAAEQAVWNQIDKAKNSLSAKVMQTAERIRAEQIASAAQGAIQGAAKRTAPVGNARTNGYNETNSPAEQQEKSLWERLVDGLKDLLNIEAPAPSPTDTPLPSPTPSATPVTLDVIPETTPVPMTPTPSPTPSPTPDFDSIRRETISQLIAAGRKLNKPFFTAYSQEVGARKDCSVQIFNLYKEIRGEKEVPFPPNTNMTCETLYKKFANYVPEGWTIYSNVPYVERRGSLDVPVGWEKVVDAGDIVIFKEDLEFTDSGDIKDNKGEWHVGLCLGNGQMLDRTKWEENNPSGKLETGLFCRGLETMPQDYDVVMIIDPGEAALTLEEVEHYLMNPPDINTIHLRP